MLGATTPGVAEAMTKALNGLPVSPIENNLVYRLLTGLNSDSARAVAQALNGNPALVEHILRNLDGQKAAQAIAAHEDWVVDLVGYLDPGALAGALNSALATPGGVNFLKGLLGNLPDGSNIGTIVARAMNANPALTQQFMERAGQIGLGSKIGQALAASNNNMLVGLLNNLDANIVIQALNDSLAYSSPDTPIPNYTLLKVLWVKLQLKMNAILYWHWTQAWVDFLGFEIAPAH